MTPFPDVVRSVGRTSKGTLPVTVGGRRERRAFV
jgi:hypothetical protein